MLRRAWRGGGPATAGGEAAADGRARWFLRGLMTNLLNPKAGAFYVSSSPQFIPAGGNVVAFSSGLAAIHATMAIAWFGLLVGATRPLRRLARPAVARTLDGMTGTALVGLGVRLALERRG